MSETRRELARQAEAQESTQRVMLAQQVLLRLPVANDAIFARLYELISSAEKTKEAYESKDLIYVTRRLRLLSDPQVFYGTPDSKLQDMEKRGVLSALRFAEAEVVVLCEMAQEADKSGALRNLVEETLRANEIRAHLGKAAREAGG